MPELLLAALIFAAFVFGSKYLAAADPGKLRKHARKWIGSGLLAIAALALLRGGVDAAVPLAAAGLWMLGVADAPAGGWRIGGFNFGGGQAHQDARLRTAALEVQWDGAGVAGGRVLTGPYAGRSLDGLDRVACLALRAGLARAGDGDSAALLETYLDRRFPGWRLAGDQNSNASANVGSGASMTEQNAYQILGLAQGASREDIARSHRALMKKVHPDHGGTARLAALLNEARDVLMRGHEHTPKR